MRVSVCARLRDFGLQGRVLTSTVNVHVLSPHGAQSNNVFNVESPVDGVDTWAAVVTVADSGADDTGVEGAGDTDDEEGGAGGAEDEDGGDGETEDEDGGGGETEGEGGGSGAEEEEI